MKKLALLSGLMALLPVSTAYAATWSSEVKIASIEASDTGTGGGVSLTFTTAPFASHTCPIRSGQYRLGGTADSIRQMSSLAVSAMLASRPVRVLWSDGCDGGGYPKLIGVELR